MRVCIIEMSRENSHYVDERRARKLCANFTFSGGLSSNTPIFYKMTGLTLKRTKFAELHGKYHLHAGQIKYAS